ncbi:hypothetical protein FGO68_gene6555 [Halteria grandinella]|uniref:tRNA-binding domain-containing protein n=1 Tax=Halteria grandinella TaxID=5974 RepID=A0A8J8NKC8_HALGN|nr:hypothetical protein FGO68_gene6555 [Halteria grandinella]
MEEVWEVFSKIDLRVGKILECAPLEGSDKLYRELIDLGEGTPRLIGSGLNGKIPVDEMLSGLVVVFANLKPRKLASIESFGMVMCAGSEDKSVIELIRPPEGSKVGDRLQLVGNPCGGVALRQEKEELLNPKKKYAERFSEKLFTNDKAEASYNGVTIVTSEGGIVRAKSLANCHIS